MADELDEAVGPLLKARDRVDAAIQGYLDKAAILKKRREAITAAIDVIRAGDDEIMAMPTRAEIRKPRVISFDEGSVEAEVKKFLLRGEKSKPGIEAHLHREGLTFSGVGLTRILKTCPSITRRGERERPRYVVLEPARNGDSKGELKWN